MNDAVSSSCPDHHLSALMSDAVAHTLDGCEVQPLGEELNPEREELLVDMDVVRERGLEIINTTAYIAITGTVAHKTSQPFNAPELFLSLT